MFGTQEVATGPQKVLAGLVAALLAACAHTPGSSDSGVIVEAPVGAIGGKVVDDVAVFRGIPYAEPPVDELRWKPPVARADWDGVLSADEFGASCFQPRSVPAADNIYHDEVGEMSEDCLSLNIWKPENAANAPVFVWIHGGSLLTGSSRLGMYDGTRLAREGVIVVSINYRLGALGFLAHPELSAESDASVSGNYGFLDQIEALRWVERNIGAFGGDPDNVTIAGESAGALSAMYLMTSPLADGLFDRAVMQSGYMVSVPSLTEEHHGHPSAESLGIGLQDALGAAGVDELRGLSPGAITDGAAASGYPTYPTVEGHVVPRQLVDSFDRGEQARVPILAGFNSGETRSLRVLLPAAPSGPAEYEHLVRTAYGDQADRFLQIYPSSSIDESMLAAVRDALYGWTAQRLAEKQVAIGQPAYLYMFDHGYPAADEVGLHAFHGAELPFMFGTIWETTDVWPRIPRTDEERSLSDAMVTYWANFARTGEPFASGAPDWPAFGEQEAFMVFDERPFPASDVLGDRYDLHEEVVCRRRAAGDQQWNWNVGLASPPLPNEVARCR